MSVQVHAYHGRELANAATRLGNQHIAVASDSKEEAEIIKTSSAPRCSSIGSSKPFATAKLRAGSPTAEDTTNGPEQRRTTPVVLASCGEPGNRAPVSSPPVPTEQSHFSACVVPRSGTLQGAKTLRRNESASFVMSATMKLAVFPYRALRPLEYPLDVLNPQPCASLCPTGQLYSLSLSARGSL